MSIIKMYGLFLRHFYLITRSFPRVLDLIYWPSIQITLWGFISNFFASISMSPLVGFNKPNIIPIVVVLPEPLGPNSPSISFSLILNEIDLTASFSP